MFKKELQILNQLTAMIQSRTIKRRQQTVKETASYMRTSREELFIREREDFQNEELQQESTCHRMSMRRVLSSC